MYQNSYRLRLVSISCEPAFTFSIDGHQLTIIEVDSVNHQPLLVDSLQIFAGKQGDKKILTVLTEPMRNRTTVLCCGKEILLTNVLEKKTYRRTGFQLNANQPIGNYCNVFFFGIVRCLVS